MLLTINVIIRKLEKKEYLNHLTSAGNCSYVFYYCFCCVDGVRTYHMKYEYIFVQRGHFRFFSIFNKFDIVISCESKVSQFYEFFILSAYFLGLS